MQQEWKNRVTSEFVRGCTRITGLVYEAPLKIFEMGTPSKGTPAQIVLSNYGGGMLQGDAVRLKIEAAAQSKTVLSSQANTHIYRNEKGVDSEFHVDCTLAPDSVFVFNTDPVVLHKEAMYRQSFSWSISSASRLMFVDWFQSGRSENGEAFEFSSFYSSLEIKMDGVSVLKERFRCIPDVDMPRNPAMFMGYDHMASVYCAGFVPDLPHIPFREITRVPSFSRKGTPFREKLVTTSYLLPVINGCVVRVLARRRLDMEPVITWLADAAVSAGSVN